MSKKHLGSSIDDFLKDEGIFEEVQAQAVKEVVAWQLAEAMKKPLVNEYFRVLPRTMFKREGANYV